MDTVLHLVESIYGAALASLILWFPLAIPRLTRKAAGWLIIAVSLIWQFGLWVAAGVLVYVEWGWVGVTIGWILGGVGVIPLALLASLIKGHLSNVAIIVGWLAASLVLRIIGTLIYSKGSEATGTLEATS